MESLCLFDPSQGMLGQAPVEDVIFFAKETPKGKDLPWPRPTRLIALDPGPFRGSGGDPLTSTAFSQLYTSLKDSSGRVLPNLLRRHNVSNPGRVAFVGFSAAHGFLNPLLDNDQDRAAIDSVLLMDACFGSGKRGYQKALASAAAGSMMVVAVTSHVGGPFAQATVLNSGTLCFEREVLAPAGLQPSPSTVRSPAPAPSGGAWSIGSQGYWLRYVDTAGKVDVAHYNLGRLTLPVMQAYLLPRFRGELSGGAGAGGGSGGGASVVLIAAVALAAAAAGWWFSRRAA